MVHKDVLTEGGRYAVLPEVNGTGHQTWVAGELEGLNGVRMTREYLRRCLRILIQDKRREW